MKYRILLNSDFHSLQVEELAAEGHFTVVQGDKDLQARVKRTSDNHLHLILDGVAGNVYTAREPDGTWVWVKGRARFVQDADRVPRKRSAGPGETAREVTPPTPAGVVRVLVEVGERVEKKQPLVVVSAMKMEMTLTAPYAGVVRAVNASVGAQVSPGDILVEIEPDAEGSAGRAEAKP